MTPNLEKLINLYADIGWYGGSKNLVTFTLVGAFEGFSGRASESWEHQWTLHTDRIETQNFTYLEMDLKAKPGRSLDNLDAIAGQALQEAERHIARSKDIHNET